MPRTPFIILLLAALWFAGCSSQQTAPPTAAPSETAYPGPGESGSVSEPYPGVEQPPLEEPPMEEAYPGPNEPAGQPAIYTPGEPTGFEPQPGDAQLERGEAFIRYEESQLLVMESYPLQAALVLRGELPDPCHKLRVVVSPPDEANSINVQVYSVRSADAICAAVLEPFEARIKLGSFAGGEFKVFVNGVLLGTISG